LHKEGDKSKEFLMGSLPSAERDRRVGKKGSLKWAKVTTTSHQMGKWGRRRRMEPAAGREVVNYDGGFVGWTRFTNCSSFFFPSFLSTLSTKKSMHLIGGT
jgi:hypothetical protein